MCDVASRHVPYIVGADCFHCPGMPVERDELHLEGRTVRRHMNDRADIARDVGVDDKTVAS